jgi:hypothetical protein
MSEKGSEHLLAKRIQHPSLFQKWPSRIVMRDIRLAKNDKN